jgi:hypothetical protein
MTVEGVAVGDSPDGEAGEKLSEKIADYPKGVPARRKASSVHARGK